MAPSGGIVIPISSSSMPPPPVPTQRRSAQGPLRRAASSSDGIGSAPPSSRSSSQHSSQQLGKRKQPPSSQSQRSSSRASTSETTKFSESVKAQIRRMSTGWKCWHCGAEGIDVAHVIPGRARRMFTHLTKSGLTTLEHLGQRENGFPLCKSCHYHFDELPLPDWVLFPEDLKYFIREERRDIKRRVQAWRLDQPLPRRSPPTATAYFEHQRATGGLLPEAHWGTYRSYIINSFGPEGREFVKGDSALKTFHGDPMVAVNHAFAGLPYSFVDLPNDLRALNTAYRINDKRIQEMKSPPPSTADDDEADSDGVGGGSDKESSTDKSPDPTPDRSRTRHSRRLEKKDFTAGKRTQKRHWGREDILVMLAPSRKPTAMMQEELFAQSIPCKRVKTSDADWQYGPRGTAQDAIDFVNFFSDGGGYVDNGPWATPVDRRKQKGTAKVEQGLLSPRVSGESIS
ncbi:MAG: hypothetical protein Q9207_002740 [Kuettlingeria erythrocarpa]